MSASAFAGVFAIDTFEVTKNGNPLFTDDFTDGSPPPSAPNLANGNPTSYGIIGAGFSEAGGRVFMDNDLGGLTVFNTGQVLGNFATLLTNTQEQGTGPGQSNTGLKRNSTFSVTGTYDLLIPAENREVYGIRLTDRGGPLGQEGNDVMELTFGRSLDGVLRVLFRDRDFDALTVVTLDALAFTPGGSDAQIALTLSHDTANTDTITASFTVLDGLGNVNFSHNFSTTGSIFSDETWTRAQFMTWSPIPEPAALVAFGLGLAGIGFLRRRRSA